MYRRPFLGVRACVQTCYKFFPPQLLWKQIRSLDGLRRVRRICAFFPFHTIHFLFNREHWRWYHEKSYTTITKLNRETSKQIDFWCLFLWRNEQTFLLGTVKRDICTDTIYTHAQHIDMRWWWCRFVLYIYTISVCVSTIKANPLSWQCFILMRYLPFAGSDIVIFIIITIIMQLFSIFLMCECVWVHFFYFVVRAVDAGAGVSFQLWVLWICLLVQTGETCLHHECIESLHKICVGSVTQACTYVLLLLPATATAVGTYFTMIRGTLIN